MTRNYVAINDPVHNLLRNLSRRCQLTPSIGPDGRVAIRYSPDAETLPDDYFSLALLHGIGGMSLDVFKKAGMSLDPVEKSEVIEQVNCFDAITLDRRCSRDLRLRPSADPTAMVSAELLSFGTGTLRALHDDPDEPFFRFLWAHHGRLRTAQEVVYARIFALHRFSRPGLQEVGKESFESTNVIYGDVYGELEQLWDRRADTAFLSQVARSFRGLRKLGTLGSSVHPPLNAPGVHRLHLERQALWKAPPATARALLRRLEYILDHASLDKSVATVFELTQIDDDSMSDPEEQQAPEWEGDTSGYDGWLADEGSVF